MTLKVSKRYCGKKWRDMAKIAIDH